MSYATPPSRSLLGVFIWGCRGATWKRTNGCGNQLAHPGSRVYRGAKSLSRWSIEQMTETSDSSHSHSQEKKRVPMTYLGHGAGQECRRRERREGCITRAAL